MADENLGSELGELFDWFPVPDGMKHKWLEFVQKQGFSAEILREGIQRLINTRKATTAPKPAELLEHCRAVKAERYTADSEDKIYTYVEARDLARRRLERMNQAPNLWKKIPITDANIDAHVNQMAATGLRVERE